MAFAPQVAEEATFAVADFAVLFLLLGLLILRFAWTHTFHVIFAALAIIFDISVGPFHPFGFLVNWLKGIDNRVYQGFGFWIGQTEHVWHKMMLWQAYVLTKTGDEIANLTYDAGVALGILHAKVSPAALAAISRPVIKNYVTTLPAVHVAIRPATTHATAVSPALVARVGRLEQELAQVRQHQVAIPAPFPLARPGAVARPAPGTIVRPKPDTGEIDRALDWAKGKIGPLAKLGTVAGIAGLVGAAVFKHFNLGWLRCSGVNRVGRALCGMAGLIESLFADALDVLLVTHLCQMVGLMEKGAKTFESEIAYLVKMTDGLAKCRGVTPAVKWEAKWYEPPAAPASIAL